MALLLPGEVGAVRVPPRGVVDPSLVRHRAERPRSIGTQAGGPARRWEGMREHRPGSALHASWLATALAAALTLAVPLTARIGAGASPAGPAAVHAALAARSARTARTARIAVDPAGSARPAPTRIAEPARARPEPALLVHARAGLTAHARASEASPSLGTVASVSKYYRVPLVLWVEAVSRDGRWGRVELPYVWPRRDGWIRLSGLSRATTLIHVEVDLSAHTVTVFRGDRALYRVRAAIGASSSPTPPGEYVVTDRVPFSPGSALGSFAFGISGIQPRLPAGWSGGNQLAIHGTNDPGSIGRSVSAGCVRVSEWALAHFEPLLRLGTPVFVRA